MRSLKVILFDYHSLLYNPGNFSSYDEILKAGINREKTWDFIFKYKREAKHFFLDLDQKGLLETAVSEEMFFNKLKNDLSKAKIYPDVVGGLEKLKSQNYKIGVVGDLPRTYLHLFPSDGFSSLVDHFFFSCDNGGLRMGSYEFFTIIEQFFGVAFYKMLLVANKKIIEDLVVRETAINLLEMDRNKGSADREVVHSMSEVLSRLYTP